MYIQGAEYFTADPQGTTSLLQLSRVGMQNAKEIVGKLTEALPVLTRFIKPASKIGRVSWHGRLKNIDVRMAV